MALITPIALSQDAIDATNIQRFYFTSSGGDQVVKNRLVIRRQSDNSVVYSNIEETYAFASPTLSTMSRRMGTRLASSVTKKEP